MNAFRVFFIVFITFASIQRLIETFSERSTSEGKKVMNWSFPAMMVVHSAVFIGSVVELFLVERQIHYWVSVLGVVIYIMSLVLRNVAIRSLGKFWSLHIEIRSEHELMTDGVYRYVRHPAYLSVILELISVPLIANAYFTVLLAMFWHFPILAVRLHKEEEALIAKFGQRYLDYRRRVPALVPFFKRRD